MNSPLSQGAEPVLLPCPFCGCAVQFRKALWPSDGCTDAIFHADPSECGLMDFSTGTTDESVLAEWNRRASSPDAATVVIQPTYYVQHPDGSHSVAEPQPAPIAAAPPLPEGWLETAMNLGDELVCAAARESIGLCKGGFDKACAALRHHLSLAVPMETK